ncbi:MAG: formate dehydrogenase accessory sulfurtransferase FdhD [Lachnospiraceae bacterium]|nr:formate dehydrogenase accessory sulfurtransferase FdhD [Lachnospiraceae bacterium]
MTKEECIKLNTIAYVQKIDECVICEHSLTITVGDLSRKITCTGSDLSELVYGFLCGEGLIKSAEDVEALVFNEDKTDVRVILCKKTDSEDIRKNIRKDGISYSPDQIYDLVNAFSNHEGIHTYTSASHTAMIGAGNEVLCIRDDISRHCAIDKVIGYALLNGIDLSECMIFSSGRMQYDTVIKLVNAGISLIASKSCPSFEAIELAKDKGIKLIGRAWPDGYTVYTE